MSSKKRFEKHLCPHYQLTDDEKGYGSRNLDLLAIKLPDAG
jgi:hypothetical protein